MSSAFRSQALPNWRMVCMAAACAAAGAGLRWGFREPQAVRADSALTAQAAPAAKPPMMLTTESLPSLSRMDRLTALAAQLPHMTVEEIAPLVAMLTATCQEGGDGWGTPESTKALLRVLFTRWAELDAHGMIAALEAPAYMYSLSARQFAVSAWTELRGIAALNAVRKKWPGIASTAAWEHLHREPGQMEELIPFLNGEAMPYRDYDPAFYDQMGPERFVPLAAAMDHIGYVWSTLRDLAAEDFSRALRIAKSLPPGNYREAALGEVLGCMNPQYELPDALKNSGVSFREEFEALPPGRARDRLAAGYAHLLAQENPDAALAWARSLPSGEGRSNALTGIAYFLPAGSSSSEAVRLLAEAMVAYPDNQDSSLISSFGEWRAADPQGADAWFQTVSDPRLRALITQEFLVAAETSQSPPPPVENARADALAAIAKDGVKDEAWTAASTEDRLLLAADAMHSRAGEYNPEKAWEFFDSLAPEERSLGAWYEAGRAQIGMDAKKASEWMQSLPPGPERDAAATALVEYLAGAKEASALARTFDFIASRTADDRDGAAAFAWAESMSGETERARYLTQAAKAWALEDAAAARAAVQAASLPDEQKESLLRQLPEGGVR